MIPGLYVKLGLKDSITDIMVWGWYFIIEKLVETVKSLKMLSRSSHWVLY